MSRAIAMMKMTATAATTASPTTMTNTSQSYGPWQVPSLGSKGAAIRLFLFKHSDHVVNDGDDDNDSDSSIISQSYRAWQISALVSKCAAITLFLFKPSDHVKSDGDNNYDSDSSSSSKSNSTSNIDNNDKDISVI